jgi:hypothetical protein
MLAFALAATVTVQFTTNDFALEWYAVRTNTAPAAYQQAMDVAKEVPDDRTSLLAMNNVDGLAAQSGSPVEFVSLLSHLPDRLEFKNAVNASRQIADEITKVPQENRDEFVKASRARVAHATNLLRSQLQTHSSLLDLIASDLGIKLEPTAIKVLVVTAAPRPGASTFRTTDGPLCVVGLLGFAEHELLEVVAHEATHAMDELSRRQDTLLARLRRSLTEAGVDPTDPRTRDVPHAVVFAAAAARVRGALGDDYVPFGEAHGAYERMGDASKAVNAVWANRGTTDETVAEIVRRVIGTTAKRT